MITNRKEIKLYKAKSILDVTEKDSLYCLKADNETEFKIIVTDAFGNPVNLKDLTGGTITNIINTDGSITITGSGVKDIKLSTTLYNLINSALQAGDNISSLTNNSGFITLSDIPAFNPLDYDLTDFTNSDVDPFARLSDIVSGSGIDSVVAGTNITVDNTDPLNPIISSTASGATNLGYTPSPTDGTVTSDSGSDATIPLADNTNAGLLSPSEKSDIASAIQPSDLATVATSGDYTDLINIPTEFNPSAHTHPISDIINLQTELDSKVDENVAIAGATKTKITYDSKGLVIAGEDALTSDIDDSLNRRYVTDAQLVVIGNTSGTNTGDNATNSQYSGLAASKQDVLTDVNFGTFSNALTTKTTPVDADTVNLVDSADSDKSKKLSFANLKAWIQSFVPTVITSETGIYYFNDFLGIFTTSTNDGNISWDANVGSSNAPNSDANKQGFANVNTTTATAGYGNIYIGHTATPNFILGGGVTIYETLIWLPNLSTSGERFSCLIGFSSGVLNQNSSANNIAFLYDEGNIALFGGGGASANWRAVTTDTTVQTFTNTGISVNAATFIKLRIVVNANASSVEFFIDNTLVATHTTNIPSGNTKRLNVRNYIQKSVGYTQRFLILDYVKLQQTFTTAR